MAGVRRDRHRGSADVGVVLAEAEQFRTGSRGYHGQTKLTINGKRYQVQAQLVALGSREANAR